jgi:hypothetical protein
MVDGIENDDWILSFFKHGTSPINFGNKSHRMRKQACEKFFNDDHNFVLN